MLVARPWREACGGDGKRSMPRECAPSVNVTILIAGMPIAGRAVRGSINGEVPVIAIVPRRRGP